MIFNPAERRVIKELLLGAYRSYPASIGFATCLVSDRTRTPMNWDRVEFIERVSMIYGEHGLLWPFRDVHLITVAHERDDAIAYAFTHSQRESPRMGYLAGAPISATGGKLRATIGERWTVADVIKIGVGWGHGQTLEFRHNGETGIIRCELNSRVGREILQDVGMHLGHGQGTPQELMHQIVATKVAIMLEYLGSDGVMYLAALYPGSGRIVIDWHITVGLWVHLASSHGSAGYHRATARLFPDGFGPPKIRKQIAKKRFFTLIDPALLHRIGESVKTGQKLRAGHERRAHPRYLWHDAGIERDELPMDMLERLKLARQHNVRRVWVRQAWVGPKTFKLDGIEYTVEEDDDQTPAPSSQGVALQSPQAGRVRA